MLNHDLEGAPTVVSSDLPVKSLGDCSQVVGNKTGKVRRLHASRGHPERADDRETKQRACCTRCCHVPSVGAGETGFQPGFVPPQHVRHVISGAPQDARCDGGTSASQALSDNWFGLVDAIDLAKQFAEKQMIGFGDVPLMELPGGPHIEQLHFAAFNSGAQLLWSCR